MTEAQWLSCNGASGLVAQHMLLVPAVRNQQRTKAGKRRLRLFAVACCRAAWSRLPDERLCHAVERAEECAEGLATMEALEAVGKKLAWMRSDGALPADTPLETRVAIDMVVEATKSRSFGAAFYMTATTAPLARRRGGEPSLCNLVRCIFGNPFRPASLDPAWLTPAVVSLAQTAYDERTLPSGELKRMHLTKLADALQDAGCTASDLLAHLRSRFRHVRGCHVVDLILGKA